MSFTGSLPILRDFENACDKDDDDVLLDDDRGGADDVLDFDDVCFDTEDGVEDVFEVDDAVVEVMVCEDNVDPPVTAVDDS